MVDILFMVVLWMMHKTVKLCKRMAFAWKWFFLFIFYVYKYVFLALFWALFLICAGICWIPVAVFQHKTMRWLSKHGYRYSRAVGRYIVTEDADGLRWVFYTKKHILNWDKIPAGQLDEEISAQSANRGGILTRSKHEPVQGYSVITVN